MKNIVRHSRHKSRKFPSANRSNESSIEKIIRALSDNRWEYRTVRGIVRETGLPENVVLNVVNSDTRIRKSMIPARQDQQLYTLKARKNIIGDAWSAFRAVSRAKYSQSGDFDE